jgi:multidrug efflux pump subunit AcrB
LCAGVWHQHSHQLQSRRSFGVGPEGEWDLTRNVFRAPGLSFAAALVLIYLLLVAQTNSLLIPGVLMVAIPLTIIGIMPGFWLLNTSFTAPTAGFANPIYFTATGMMGI